MANTNNPRKVLALIGAAAMFAMVAGSSFAATETAWQKDHPRRTEVNKRLKNQDKRIHNEVKKGEISKTRAHQLHKEDQHIRKKEHAMASQNGGHISKQQQKILNQQENAVSKQIGK
jgi:hypothetical protein